MTVHGVYYQYADGGRCAACTAAWVVDIKQRRHRREELTAIAGLPEKVKHGLSAYTNWGCRCVVCAEAKRVRNEADRARRKASR